MKFPRRNRIDLCHTSELAIDNAIMEVDKLCAEVNLTSAIQKLQEARELVSNYIDSTIYLETRNP